MELNITRAKKLAKRLEKKLPQLRIIYLQRKLSVGYVKAFELYNELVTEGLVTPLEKI